MKLLDASFDSGKALGCGFDQQQHFLGTLDLCLPPIDALDRRQNVDAGGESFIDEGVRDMKRLFVIAARAENDKRWRHKCKVLAGSFAETSL
jgi:hypothetical protein